MWVIKLIGNEYLKIINELNAKSSTDTLKKQKDYENWLDKVKLIETDPPEKKYILKKKRGSIKGIKKITLKDLEHDKEIGDAGEDAVYRQELRIVEKYRNEKFLERVEHVSKDNDTLGYDIKSVTENGDDKYIEVKTTTQGKNTSFEISKGEINCSKEKGIKYYIYRVYEFKPKKEQLNYFKIIGDVSEQYNLKPIQCSCDPTDKKNNH